MERSFLGDGGGPNSVAKGDNGQWMYLFRPKDGKLESEKLVNLAKHDYTLEPNAHFHPGRQMDRLPLEYARADRDLCGRDRQRAEARKQ